MNEKKIKNPETKEVPKATSWWHEAFLASNAQATKESAPKTKPSQTASSQRQKNLPFLRLEKSKKAKARDNLMDHKRGPHPESKSEE